MRAKIINYWLLIRLVLMGGWFASSGRAQEAEPIYVRFDFGVRAVADLAGTNRFQAETNLAQRLAARCATNLPYWPFKVGTATNFPHLRVCLEKGLDLRVVMELRAGPTEVARGPWPGIMVPVGDDGRIPIPAAAALASEIETCFQEKILGAQSPAILAALMDQCPLGRRVLVLSKLDPPAGVLPLAGDKYGSLSTSVFEIRCRLLRNGRPADLVVLHSEGIGFDEYRVGTNINFTGIGIRHDTWEQGPAVENVVLHTNRLHELVSGFFYLRKINKDSLEDGFGNTLNTP